MGNQIEEYRRLRKSHDILYTHCANCLESKPANMSPEDWANLEAIIDRKKGIIIVGCKRCKMPIIAALLTEETHEKLKDCQCAHCIDRSKMN